MNNIEQKQETQVIHHVSAHWNTRATWTIEQVQEINGIQRIIPHSTMSTTWQTRTNTRNTRNTTYYDKCNNWDNLENGKTPSKLERQTYNHKIKQSRQLENITQTKDTIHATNEYN